MAKTTNLTILQGKTFTLSLRWETEPIVYRGITNVQQTAPARLTVPGHGMVDGWRAAITNVKGMTEINAEANNVKDRDYHPVTVVDSNTIEINDINAAGFKAYQSGGYVQFNTPIDLAGYTARMSIKDKVGGTELESLTTENSGILINNTNKTITLSISAADTAAYDWKSGVFDLEMVSASGVVTAIITGKVTVTKEVTT